MTKPSNIAGIETATKKSWDDWVVLLDKAGSRQLAHGAIVELVTAELGDSIENTEWWAQTVTVAFEQHIGRRAPGQRSDGSYEVSVTKLIDGPKDLVFDRWCELYAHVTELGGMSVDNLRTSVTPVRSYWRCDFADGSRFALAVEQRTPAKSLVSATHTKVHSNEDKDQWQRFWRGVLDTL